MSIQWKKGFDVGHIIEKSQEFMQVSENNVAKSSFWEDEWYISTLFSMLELPSDIPEFYLEKAIKKAFVEMHKCKEFTDKALLKKIKQEIGNYYKLPNTKFHLLTSISLVKTNVFPNMKIGGCHLSFFQRVPQKYSKSRNRLFQERKEEERKDYLYVVASILAKSEREAAGKCLESIDLFRGIINLHENHLYSRHWGPGERKAVNQLILGKIHTLHGHSGDLCPAIYWYEPEYQSTKYPYKFKNTEVLDFIQEMRQKLSKSKFSTEIEKAIIRYTRALDYLDLNVSLLKLWSLLEFLTDTGMSGYDETIKRTIFHFEDRDVQRQILEHLRETRNRSVHNGIDVENIRIRVYQLKRYVEVLIFFHLSNAYKFSTFKESCEFCSTTTDERALREQIVKHELKLKMCKAALKYQKIEK